MAKTPKKPIMVFRMIHLTPDSWTVHSFFYHHWISSCWVQVIFFRFCILRGPSSSSDLDNYVAINKEWIADSPCVGLLLQWLSILNIFGRKNIFLPHPGEARVSEPHNI